MQFCNTLLRQRRQSSVALNHYVVERRASTNHGAHYSAVSSNAETSAKYQLSTAWWNDWLAARGHDNFSQWFSMCSSKFDRGTAPFDLPWLHAWQQWLIATWFCLYPFVASANRWIAHAGHEKTNLTWLAKSATNSKMRSLLWLDQGPPNYGPRKIVIDEKIHLRKFVDLVEYGIPRNNHIT